MGKGKHRIGGWDLRKQICMFMRRPVSYPKHWFSEGVLWADDLETWKSIPRNTSNNKISSTVWKWLLLEMESWIDGAKRLAILKKSFDLPGFYF